MRTAGEAPLAVPGIVVAADNIGCGGGHRGRIGGDGRVGHREIEAGRELMRRIVPGGFVFVAKTQVDCDPAVYFPIVLEVHAIKFGVRIGGRPAVHGGIAAERAEQEGGIAVTVNVGVRIVERVRGERGIEVELRRIVHIHQAIAGAHFEASLQEVRAFLVSDLGVVVLASGPLVPVETAAAETVSVHAEVGVINRLVVDGWIQIIRIPIVVAPDLRPTVRSEGRRNISSQSGYSSRHGRSKPWWALRKDGISRNLPASAECACWRVESCGVAGGIAGVVGGVVARHAAENFPLVADVVIGAIGIVVIVEGFGITLQEVVDAGDVGARIIGSPHLAHEGGGDGIHAIGRDDVAREWRDRDGAGGGIDNGSVRVEDLANAADPVVQIIRLRVIAVSFQGRLASFSVRYRADRSSNIPSRRN